MEDGEGARQNREAHCLLAGLETGIVAALILLGWLALASAWYVSVTASCLLFAALAIAPMWDTALYFRALNEALVMDHM